MCRASLWARALLVLCALTAQASLVPGKVKVTKGAVVLRNPSGMEAHILPVGACVQRLLVPDRDGKLADVMAGFDDPEEYRVRGDRPGQALLHGVTNRAATAAPGCRSRSLTAPDRPCCCRQAAAPRDASWGAWGDASLAPSSLSTVWDGVLGCGILRWCLPGAVEWQRGRRHHC
jgi:hypothetical protein